MEYKETTLESVYVDWFLDLHNDRIKMSFGEYCDKIAETTVII